MPRYVWKNLPRLYSEHHLGADGSVILDSAQQHYLLHVLRKAEGSNLLLFNADDGEWLATITHASKKQMTLTCREQTRAASVEARLGLAFALIKRDHQDYMIQKATELGVTDFYPLKTQHSAVVQLNTERLGAIAREAAEQSERLALPRLMPTQPLLTAITDLDSQAQIFACLENGRAQPIADAIPRGKPELPPIILIGPEGGFSDEEMTALGNCASVIPVSLGPRILRADTAAIAALSCWQALRGDWRS